MDAKIEVPSPFSTEKPSEISNTVAASTSDPLAEKTKKKPKKKVVFFVGLTKYPVVRYVGRKLLDYKLTDKPEDLFDVMWTDSAVTPDQFDKLKLFQKVNHFPGMYSLARKNHLGRHLMRMREKFPNFFRFFPKTYLLPADYSSFKAASLKKNKTFIVKPEASCQGRGIYLTRSFENVDLMDHVVIQNYLEKPFLIDNLKFDLRIYVLLTGCDPLRIFIHQEGLARFATEEYKPPKGVNLENLFMHLTNYAINKKNKNFVFNKGSEKDSEGHKRSLISVFQLLKSQGHDTEKLMTEIERMIVKMFCSVQPILAHNYYSCQPQSVRNDMCFEVLGLDILLDHKLKPYLIEVNHTPSFSTDTPLDKAVKRAVIRDSLVLMNIDQKHRVKYFKDQKKEFEKRTVNLAKPNAGQKEEAARKAKEERDLYEEAHLGGFKRLYPKEKEEEPYQEFMDYARILWQKSTGTFIGKKNEENKTKNEENKEKIGEIRRKNKENTLKVEGNWGKAGENLKKIGQTNMNRSQSQSSASTKNTLAASKPGILAKIPKLESKKSFKIPENPNSLSGKFVPAKLMDFGGFGMRGGNINNNNNGLMRHFV